MKKIFILLLFVLSFVLVCCKAEEKVKITITVEESEIEISLGDEIEVNAEVNGIEGEDLYKIVLSDDSILSLDGNKIKAIKTGETSINVVVNADNTIFETIAVKVLPDSVAPEMLGVEDKNISWGGDPLEGVSATDNIDGDLTNKIQVLNFDNQQYGEQEVTYKVSDNAGNETIKKVKLNVVWDYEVMFIGHAGSYFGLANSEEAFLYAVKDLHYQAIECDVKQTKDGVFVTSHDDTVNGITISQTNYADLVKKDLTVTRNAGYPKELGMVKNGGQYSTKICTLERYLEICKEYNAYAVIELKDSKGITNSDQSRMPALMDLIKKCGMLDKTIFLGSAYNCLIWVKENGYDYIPCQYLVNSCESQTYLDRCKQYHFDLSINVTGDNISNSMEWISKYKEIGCKVSAWTFTQYVDYETVQEWIDKGVDFVTCDWHQMDKLNLPKQEDTEYKVTFKDADGITLKTGKVKSGQIAIPPNDLSKKGYTFIGWDKPIYNIREDKTFTAVYEKNTYSINYIANFKSSEEEVEWESKTAFVNEFYEDLYNWLKDNKDKLTNISYNDGEFTTTSYSTYGSQKFSNANTLKAINVYVFEARISRYIYKPISGTNSADLELDIDDNYFLNTEPYRTKYKYMNGYFLNCINTSYTSYSKNYEQASNNRVQIMFRFHQWCNGTSIAAFNTLPKKVDQKIEGGITVTMPTTNLTYTVDDEIILPKPSPSDKFLGWYDNKECAGSPITKIEKGSVGNIKLYAKWNYGESTSEETGWLPLV